MNLFKEPAQDYDQIGHQPTGKRGNLDATAQLSGEHEKPEKIVCKREPYNVCYRINLRKREIIPTEHVSH